LELLNTKVGCSELTKFQKFANIWHLELWSVACNESPALQEFENPCRNRVKKHNLPKSNFIEPD